MIVRQVEQEQQTAESGGVRSVDPITEKHARIIAPLRLQPLESIQPQPPMETILIVKDQSVQPITQSGVLDVIKSRRSVGQVTQQEPTREQIERLLEAATYAPSYHVTEPWQFIVLTGEAREQLGDILAASLSLRLDDRYSQKARDLLARERSKPLRAPVIITVAMMGVKEMKGRVIENVEAAGAAVQNMLLAAEEMKLAAIWRTGESAYDPLVKRWLGMSCEDHIVGFVYVGFPKVVRPPRVPTHFSTKTVWLS